MDDFEQLERLAFDGGPLGMVLFDLDRVILRANRALCTMLGYAGYELKGRLLAEITHPADRQADRELMERLKRRQIPNYTTRKQYQTKAGQTVWAEVTVTLLRSPGQTVAMAVVKDITAERRSEIALRHAERLASLGTMAVGIAHEVNDPLGAILLLAESARQLPSTSDPGVRCALEQIRQQAVRCGQIVQSVLHFARQQKSEKWLARIEESVQRAADFTHHMAQQNNVTLDLDATADTPPVWLNPAEMELVFVNLIVNGIQACHAGGRVYVGVQASVNYVEAVVENNGPEMTAEQAERLFDPFYVTRSDTGGTGLGLSVAQGIVHGHGGAIHVESHAGHGTRFTVAIPLPEPADSNAQYWA
jgi:PAS domain S-box-containing protein